MALDIVILGLGNVGSHLVEAIQKTEHLIACLYSRNQERINDLPVSLQPLFTSQIQKIPAEADVYILAISDSGIEEVSNKMNVDNGIVCHTSGATSSKVLNKHNDYGIFYPLQTFTKGVEVDFTKLPICVYSNNSASEELLKQLALQLSPNVYSLNDADREHLHVAAVFANNFSNHMFAQAEKICKEYNVPFELLHPLINVTCQKALINSPASNQTGPAKRGDQKTIDKHLNKLEFNTELKAIYQLLSDHISSLKMD